MLQFVIRFYSATGAKLSPIKARLHDIMSCALYFSTCAFILGGRWSCVFQQVLAILRELVIHFKPQLREDTGIQDSGNDNSKLLVN